MAIRLRGGGIEADAEVELLTKALRVTPRPMDYSTGGSFHKTVASGVMSGDLAAASPIFAFRIASASMLALVRKLRMSAWLVGPATDFVAGAAKFELLRATGWTVADTGGVTATITTVQGKLRSSMSSIASLAEIRYSSIAALSAGTRVLDSDPLEVLVANVPDTADYAFVPTTKMFDKLPGEYPLVLAENEGFILRATVPGNMTWSWALTTEFDEVPSF